MFNLRRTNTKPQESAHPTTLSPARIAAYLNAAHTTHDAEHLLTLTLELLEEYGATAHATLRSHTAEGKLVITPEITSVAWGHTFGALRPHLQPGSLKVLTKKTLHGRNENNQLTSALVSQRDVRLLDAYGLANLLGITRRTPPTGTVIAIPMAIDKHEALHLLAYMPRRKVLVEHGLAPLLRSIVLHKSDLASGTGSSVSRQWLLADTHTIIASSHELRTRRPDLTLDNGSPIERTFPTARVELEQLERALLLQPNPEGIALDFDAVARGSRGEHHVTLSLQVTPIRIDAGHYAFVARPSTAEGESLQELGDSAILHTTMHQIGMFLILDRFGTIHSATESLTDNLGYEPLAVKDLNITALLDEESIPTFNRLRENALALLHQPGDNSRVPTRERAAVTLRTRDDTKREFNLSLMLLRTRIEGETLPRGFVAVINITDGQMLLQKELTERLRHVRHDRHSSANAIAALVDEIRRAPKLTRGLLNQKLTDVHDEARVWSEITDTHAQLLDAVTTLSAPKPEPHEQTVDLTDIVIDQIPRYVRFYARHKLRRADRERVTIKIQNRLEGVTAWARDTGRLTVYYALRNLVENAVKYAIPGSDGERAITAGLVLDPEQPDHVRIEITNAVTGLDHDSIKDAWEYKKRLVNTAHDPRGTGIGLWSTQKLVERAGGRVGAYLHDDRQHVTFYISFPLLAIHDIDGRTITVRDLKRGNLAPTRPEDIRAAVRIATTPQGTTPKILVLDPDPEDLTNTANHFRHVKAQVTPTQNATQATQALKANDYDLFLTEYDHYNPGETEALVRYARRRGATARVLTSTPSAAPERLLEASSAPKAIYKQGLNPKTAANLAYGGRESYEPHTT